MPKVEVVYAVALGILAIAAADSAVQHLKRNNTSATTNLGYTGETTRQPLSGNTSSEGLGSCFCTYHYRKDLLHAFVEDKPLKDGNTVKKGEAISFICQDSAKDIVWPNGFRMQHSLYLNCTTCQEWHERDLPYCDSHRPAGDAIIIHNRAMKFLPGGIIEVEKLQRIRLMCNSPWGQPQWHVGERKGIRFFQSTAESNRITGEFIAYMFIEKMMEEHSGIYQCTVRDFYGNLYRPAVVNLQIADIRCPHLNQTDMLITYTNDRKINSDAVFTCKSSTQRLIDTDRRTCLPNGQWSGQDPSCEEPKIQCDELSTYRGRFIIHYQNERRVNSTAQYECADSSKYVLGENVRKCLSNGKWSKRYPRCTGIRCPHINKTNMLITYTNDRKINSDAIFTCESSTLRLIGTDKRTCLRNGQWSGQDPSCEALEIRCDELSTDTHRGRFIIHYQNERRINSTAQYECADSSKYMLGETVRKCLSNGKWSKRYPRCTGIRCSHLNETDMLITYTNDRKIYSDAVFACKSSSQRLIGTDKRTCLPNGQWSGQDPSCEDYAVCNKFGSMPHLDVSYSDGVRVGSTASFRCSDETILVGSSHSTCNNVGKWTHPSPTCKASSCSIDNLMDSLPEGIYPDMSDVTREEVDSSFELRLQCEDLPTSQFILVGSSKAICSQGKWEFGNVQCISVCVPKTDISSRLIIEPRKDHYRFGESLTLSCVDGYELTSDIQKLMCLGSSWSDEFPDCIERAD